MLIKINKQPIEVTTEDQEESGINWVQLCISGVAFVTLLSLLDYIGYIFVGIHPMPFMRTVTKFILWLIGG